MRVHHLWIRLIGIIGAMCSAPVAAADAFATPVPVCQRTPRVRDALVRATCPRCSCGDITPERLAALNQLSLSTLGLRQLKPGDLSGLTSLETLDVTGNPLKALPGSLASELGALKRMKMDLSLFTRLPDEVVTPLLDRPGFNWELVQEGQACGPYTSRVPQSTRAQPLSEAEAEAVVQPSPGYKQMEIRAWTRGIHLVAVWTADGHLELSAISKNADQRWSLLAKAEQPVILLDEFSAVLDLAPYRLSPSEMGFGVRRMGSGNMPSNLIVQEEELQVFRIHGGKIEQVLRTVVYTRHEKAGPPPGVPDEEDYEVWHWKEEICAVIAVARSKTRDVFNWVKVQSGTSTAPPPVNGPPPLRAPSTVFRWTGERYSTSLDVTTSVLFRNN